MLLILKTGQHGCLIVRDQARFHPRLECEQRAELQFYMETLLAQRPILGRWYEVRFNRRIA